ncbi:MAG: YaiI/YqxD family protein [Alphaproteobacteria bacterium]|nr:YaiI/YqxD family protein [Alphaproteobacteria bacterium]
MLEIYIDADACPVKDEVMKVAGRHALVVHLVSNRWMRMPESTLLHKVVVEAGPDVADNWIAEHIGPGDVVVTADIPLASRCVKRGARVIDPTGKCLDEASIGMAVAMRDLMTGLRETGAVTSRNAAFTPKDRSRFLSSLETMLQAIRRQ